MLSIRCLAATIPVLLCSQAYSFVSINSLRRSQLRAPKVIISTHHLQMDKPLISKDITSHTLYNSCDRDVEQSHHTVDNVNLKKKGSKKYVSVENHRHFLIGVTLLLIGMVSLPSSSFAISNTTPADLKASLVSILDKLASSGTKGMVVYTLSFIVWTMTIGATTPIETAAGMAFPLQKAIPLSAIGKISGALFQYMLAKYLFADYARKKMKDNKWMDKISASFKHHPYRVALIWRFSPLPEFVKNIGPALVPTLRTRYQILAILTHGIPFTILWSIMGNEAAVVARGGHASVFMKRMVAVITWVGLVVSPTLFGMWVKGLGDESTEDLDIIPE